MPCFSNALRAKAGNLLVLHRQDAVEHLDHGHLRAQRAVEAGELDADGARAHDQQRFRQGLAAPSPRDRSRSACRRAPSPAAARARAPVARMMCWRCELGDGLAVLRSTASLPPARPACRRRRYTVILFFFIRMPDAARKLLRDRARARHDLRQVELHILGREAESSRWCSRCLISAERSSALVGMQPQFRQMPPRCFALDHGRLQPAAPRGWPRHSRQDRRQRRSGRNCQPFSVLPVRAR